jgi:hypothetical protein
VQSGDEAYRRMDPTNEEARQEVVTFLATSEGRSYAALAESEITFAYDQSPVVDEVGSPPSSPRCTPKGARVGDVAGLLGSVGGVSLYNLIYGTSPSLFVLLGEATPAALAEARALLADAIEHLKPVPACAFVVLRSAPPNEPVPGDLLYDPTGLLHQRLGDAGPCLCLIRPDGHLGFRCSPPSPDALRAYLARIYRV